MRVVQTILRLMLVLVLLAVSSYALDPAFEVTANSGKTYRSSELRGSNVVLEWFNAGCPFVKRIYESGEMQRLQAEYTKKGFVWLTVNSTNEEHRDFIDVEEQKKLFQDWKSSPSDYISDKDGALGHLMNAKTTPHLFIVGKSGEVVYQGAFDDFAAPDFDEGKRTPYFENALSEVAQGKPVTVKETVSYGCSIKYQN